MHHAGYSAAQELHRVYENAAPEYKLIREHKGLWWARRSGKRAGASPSTWSEHGFSVDDGHGHAVRICRGNPGGFGDTRRVARTEELSPVAWSSPQSDQSSSRTNEASGTLRDQPNSSRAATMAETEARSDVGLGRENEVVEEQVGRRPNTDEPERESSEMQAEWPANPGPELKEEAELVRWQ
ncbi:hypothetical protein ACLKA6_016403 [Drosophila palustris]